MLIYVRAAADVVQVLNLLMSVAMLLLCIVAWRRWKAARPYVFGVGTWAAHSVVFYIVALAGWFSGPWASFFSALRVFHITALILGMLVALFLVALSPDGLGYEMERHDD
jgi:hypothetical protein